VTDELVFDVAAYAAAKALPEDWLRDELGLRNVAYFGSPAVAIPYLDQDGAELVVRYRLAMNGAQPFRWPQGTRAKGLVYGLEERKRAIAAGVALLVEGESDTQTARFHGFAAFGIPGVGNFDDERTSPALDGLELVFVQEPGDAGEKLREELRRSRLRDRIRVATLAPHKDVSELHLELGGDREAFRAALEEAIAAAVELELEEEADEAPAQERSLGPAEALAVARVDLVELITHGIPERDYVPGGEPWLLAGKRYLIPAPAGTGKSLLAIVVAVDVVDAGGTAAILDVENGADEYARRLEDVLAARGSPELERACSERLRYFAWPALRVTWRPGEWAAALAGANVVVFDSSRLVLSTAGLQEDSNDDYAAFVNGLLVPLARAGIATVVLDNVGHDDPDRARGASAKSDLNEVVYSASVGEDFARDQEGYLRLVRRRTRFAELPEVLRVPLGGGTYGPAIVQTPSTGDREPFRPTVLMERVSRYVEARVFEERPSMTELEGLDGKAKYLRRAAELLVDEGYLAEEKGPRNARLFSSVRPYREADDEHA
jgi:AAA domain